MSSSFFLLSSKIHGYVFSLCYILTLWFFSSCQFTRSLVFLSGFGDPFWNLKSQKILCVAFSRRDFLIYPYTNGQQGQVLIFLHSSQGITFPIHSCLPLYFFCVSLQYSLINRFHLSPHNLHLLFCCLLTIFALIKWDLMTLFYAAIKRDSVSFRRLPLSSPFPDHFVCNFLSLSQEISIRLFIFPFLFSRFCCFPVYPKVITLNVAIIGCGNQSFIAPWIIAAPQ